MVRTRETELVFDKERGVAMVCKEGAISKVMAEGGTWLCEPGQFKREW